MATAATHRYTFAELVKLWTTAGGEPKWAPIMAAVALSESGGNAANQNRNKNGTIDRGLWQINSSHGWGTSSFNPVANAKQAVTVFRAQGAKAWTTYTNGNYLRALPSRYANDPRNATITLGSKGPKIAGAPIFGGLGNEPDITDASVAAGIVAAAAPSWLGGVENWAGGAALRTLAYLVLTVLSIVLFVLGLERVLGPSPMTNRNLALEGAKYAANPSGIPY